MEWIQYLLMAFIVYLLFLRFKPVKGLRTMKAQELKQRLKKKDRLKIVDVRQKHEYDKDHIKGAMNIPLGNISEIAQKKLDVADELVLVCLSGNRSKQAARKLQKLGFTSLNNLSGGMMSWNRNK